MLINVPNLLVYFAMVSDGPTTLGLRPQNEDLHLEECSEWVQFPCFLHTNTPHKAGGYFPNHFPYFLIEESTHEWGGGVEGLGKGQGGGASSIGAGVYYTTRGDGGGGFMVWVMAVHKSLMSDV